MPNSPRISLYERLQQRRIAVAILLSLSLHGVVLAFLKPSPPSVMQPQTVNVYLDKSSPSERPQTHTTAPRLLTKPAEVNAEKPVQTVIETPSPPSPAAVEESAVVPPQSNLPAPQKIESISSLTRVPGPLKKIEAAYPAAERRAGMQAYVLAEVIIDAHGIVQDVHILKSGGNAFDAAVIEALKKSAFTPGYIGDNAVSVRISIPFRFNLN